MAFTLVELLIVIGIITILISILLPALSRVRKAAQEVVCQSNLRQFGIGATMYADQNKGRLPIKGPDGSDAGTNNFGPPNKDVVGYDDQGIWFNAIPPFINSKSYFDMLVADSHGLAAPSPNGPRTIFTCPAAGSAGTLNGHDVVFGDYFLLWGTDSTHTIKNSTGLASNRQFKFAMSYVWNSKLASTISHGDVSNIRITDAQPASEVVLMTEKLANPGEYIDPEVQQYNASYPGVYAGQITPQGYDNKLAQSKADFRRFTTRHRHGGFLLFIDGHVSWFAWPQVQIQDDQMPYNPDTSDANQYGKLRWSALGPVN
jgi:type II secretory pathway pseudopilin PulG